LMITPGFMRYFDLVIGSEFVGTDYMKHFGATRSRYIKFWNKILF